MKVRSWRGWMIACGALCVAPLCAEAAFRALAPRLGVDPVEVARYRTYLRQGRSLGFESRAHTVYQVPRWRTDVNAWGYVGTDWRVERTPGVPRVLCLGGSTTARRYPRQLATELTERWGCFVEVLNAGVPGWTTAEAVVAWFLTLQDFQPDLVVIHFAVNDVAPRSQGNFLADYSHWRRPLRLDPPSFAVRWLSRVSDLATYAALRAGRTNVMDLTSIDDVPAEGIASGRLPASTSAPFRRNVEAIGRSARSLGAHVLLMTMPVRALPTTPPHYETACEEHNVILRELADEHGWWLADAERFFAEHAPELDHEFRDFVHLSRRGDEVKASLVADAIVESLGTTGDRQPGAPPPDRADDR